MPLGSSLTQGVHTRRSLEPHPGEGSHETLKRAEPGTEICADVQSLVTPRTSCTHSKVVRGPKGVFVPITDHAIDSHSFRECSRLLAASNLIVSAHSGCFPSRQAALAPSGSQGSSGVAQAQLLPVYRSQSLVFSQARTSRRPHRTSATPPYPSLISLRAKPEGGCDWLKVKESPT